MSSKPCLWCRQSDDFRTPSLHPQAKTHTDMTCPECQRLISLVDVNTAGSIAQKSRKTIYDWIRNGRVRTIRLIDDRSLIVYSSLFQAPVSEEDENFPE